MEDTRIYVHSECCSAHCKVIICNSGQTWVACEKCGKPIIQMHGAPPASVTADTQDTDDQEPKCEIECGVEYDEAIGEHAVPIEVFSFNRNAVRAELCIGTTVELEDKPISVWRVRSVSNFPLQVKAVGRDGSRFDSREVSSVELTIEGVDPYVLLCDLFGFGQYILDGDFFGEDEQ